MQDRLRHSRHAAAARVGFSARTARRIANDPRLPSQRRAERGRTVPDPLGDVWEPVLLAILENDPAVQAVTLLRHLQMTDPEAFPTIGSGARWSDVCGSGARCTARPGT